MGVMRRFSRQDPHQDQPPDHPHPTLPHQGGGL